MHKQREEGGTMDTRIVRMDLEHMDREAVREAGDPEERRAGGISHGDRVWAWRKRAG